MNAEYKILFLCCLLGIVPSISLCAQTDKPKKTMVYLERCETLSFDEQRHPDAQLLRGDVVFRHDSAYMYCDSAFFYENDNSLDAFGHVRLVQGDTLRGFGDTLYYDGNTRMARLRGNVRLEHNDMTLTTTRLNYNRQDDIAWYFTGGKVKDTENTLTSVWGQYTPYNTMALFKTDVVLINEDFTLTADTLKYNTETNIADLVGPTDIIYEEETHIFSTNGWYNTENERSMLLDRSWVKHTDGRSMIGDTIYYDKQNGWGKAIGNIEMRDTANQVTLYGNYCEAYEEEERGFATDSALLVDWSEEDDYSYMHADTLFTETVHDSVLSLVPRDSIMVDSILVAQAPDTIWRDTSYNFIRAHYGVRVYRSDMQAICDSLAYLSRDSIMQMYGTPVLWNDGQQISAQFLNAYIKNGELDYVYGTGEALLVKQETTKRFDQLSGKEMKGYVRDSHLTLIEMSGNAETIVFPRDEDDTFIGMNKTESSYVKLYFVDDEIDHVVFTTATSGTLYPLEGLAETKTYLPGFFWAEDERPKKPGDVFLRPEKTARPVKQAMSATATSTQDSDADKKASADKKSSAKNKNRKNNKK